MSGDLFAQGLALHRAGRLDEARAAYEAALAQAPATASLHANLGNVAMQQGRLEEAIAHFSAAVAGDARLIEAHAGMGDALAHLGRAAEAEASYLQAVALDPAHVETLASLTMLAFARGDGSMAMAYIRAGLDAKENARTRRVFSEIVRRLRWEGDDAQMRVLLLRAIEGGWGRAGRLGGAVADLVKHRLRAGGTLESDTLLLAYLAAAPNCDFELEAILARVRRQMLARARSGQAADLPFSAALAQQCFINDYVFALAPGEEDEAQGLKTELEASPETAPPLLIAAVAAYFPLHSLAGAQKLLQRALPAAIEALLRQQIAEPLEEARLAAQLPAITPISEGVSRKVRAQYEEHPYPRWVKAASPDDAIPLNGFLVYRFPAAYRPQPSHAVPRMLSAGCGTGQYALELVQRFKPASVTALDLSRASLAYAARKAGELKLDIAFAQADILGLDPDPHYDLIEASGVLHHMAEPFAGWRALNAALAPGGVMLVALYSRAARQRVQALRDWIAREGYAATPSGIRACRQTLMAQKREELGMMAGAADLFSISACRDLLFHVEEHGMDISAIAEFLKEIDLSFLGFETSETALAAYRARFPADAAATNLDNWAALEAERPATFAAMYQFWIQKPA